MGFDYFFERISRVGVGLRAFSKGIVYENVQVETENWLVNKPAIENPFFGYLIGMGFFNC